MALKIRPVEPRDLELVLPLAKAMRDESPRYQRRRWSEDKVRMLVEYFASGPHGGAFVADEDGQIVGMVAGGAAEDFFGPDMFGADLVLYVTPEKRGSSAAMRLVRAFETWCFANPAVTEITLGVSTGVHAEATVRMYEKLGYRLIGYTLVKQREA